MIQKNEIQVNFPRLNEVLAKVKFCFNTSVLLWV
jgi:hypothetical protein